MTTYTEYDLSQTLSGGAVSDWGSASLWSTASAPNDPAALVVFEALSGGKSYTVQIKGGESFGICTLDMLGSKLVLAGSLTLQTGVNVISDSAQIDMAGGTLTAGNLHLAGTPDVVGIIGTGTISASDYLYIQSSIVSTAKAGCGETLAITGGKLVNAGLLEADSRTKLLIDVANFTNFHGGTLSGGAYEAKGGVLELHTTGAVTSDDAHIILDGFFSGAIESYDSAAGRYVPLQSSLTTITAHGSLDLDGALYLTNLALTNNGAITLGGTGAALLAPSLVNDGTITIAGHSAWPEIIAAKSITGTGAIIVDSGATVDLAGSITNTIQFAGGGATAILDIPKSMSGAFAGFTAGDHISLLGHKGTVTDSYSGTADSGILTLQQGSTILHLAFQGDYTLSNFKVTADFHGIEIVGVGAFHS